MQTGTITMEFNEVVKMQSVDVSQLKFQSANNDSAVESAPLEGDCQGSQDSTSVIIKLKLDSANKLRAVSSLAVEKSKTFLTASDTFATDAANNFMKAITSDDAIEVQTFEPDKEPPTASGFSIDLKLGTVTLTFTQPIDAGTVTTDTAQQLTFIHDQTNPEAEKSHTLTGLDPNADAPSGLSQEVTLTFNSKDLNAIKERALCDHVHKIGKCFVKFTNGFIKDATGLSIDGVAATGAIQAIGYVADDVAPTLDKFRFDNNLGKITFEFDEPIDSNSFKPGAITLQNDDANTTATLSLTLGGGTIDAGSDNTKLVMSLTPADLARIKLAGMITSREFAVNRLCTRRAFCWMKIAVDDSGAPAFTDFGGNGLTVTTDDENLKIKSHVKDTTLPKLIKWSLNMQTSSMSLTFSEAINAATFTRSAMTLLAAPGSTTKVKFSLCAPGASCSSQTHGTELTVDISDDDMNKIKLGQFATAASNAYLSVTEHLVKDLALDANNVAVIAEDAATKCEDDGYTADSGAPVFTGFTFSLDTGAIQFSFDEPVKPAQFSAAGIVLQGSKTTQDPKVVIAAGTAEETSALSMTVTYIVVGRNFVDLVTTSGLFTEEDNSYISIPAGAIKDSTNNGSDGVPASNALKVSVAGYTGDTTPGKLVRFDVDFALRQLQFTFDEIVKVNTFVAADVMIQSQQLRCPSSTTIYFRRDCEGEYVCGG
jgi:hypothetical protein